MMLTLLLEGPARMMGSVPTKSLQYGSMVIGRSPTADWVLPDPEKVVSKSHCRVDADIDGFVVTDTSSNGLFVNGEPVGFGISRKLAHGDELRLGDVVVGVRIESPAPDGIDTRLTVVAPGWAGGPFAGPPPEARPEEARNISRTILDDWWKEDAASQVPKAVDIPPQAPIAVPEHANVPRDSHTAAVADTAGFVQMLSTIDSLTLARAVETASATLSEVDRRQFFERLRDVLRDQGQEKN